VDIDNDGDLDIVLAETIYNAYTKYDNTTIRLFKNNADGSFTEDALTILGLENISGASSVGFSDVDGDGDLDAFVGLGFYYNSIPGGTITYYLNENPPPATTVSSSTLVYIFGSGPVVVDAAITISDSDSDEISKAVLIIQGYQTGDILGFTPQGNVTGVFDIGTGTLTLTGLASISTYQDILRSVTYDYTGAQPTSAGKSSPSGRTVVVNKSIDLTVFDTDATTPITQSLAIALTVPNVVSVVTPSAGVSTYAGTPIAIDPTIGVIDNDDADLAGAVIQISSSTFVSGEDDLLFINQNGITGAYNSGTGMLTLTGTTSVANYQTALQSIQYQNTSSTPTGATRIVEFSVDDGEGFSPIANKTLNISAPPPNQPPVITPTPISVAFNGIFTIDLNTITTDPDGNLDPTTFAIVQQPASGTSASITGTTLTIDYTGTNFAGSDNIIIEVFDVNGERAEATLNITVVNQAPVITTTQLNTVIQGLVSIDLLSLVSDADGNLDPNSFNIFQQPVSGALASISSTTLTLDYSNTTYVGLDNLIIEVFDLAGERAEATIEIQVDGEISVRNGISPNGDGLNDYFKVENIEFLGPQNTVKIFTRWGDKVFEVKDYDNLNRRFEGKGDSGKDLPSGVYFYQVTFANGRPELSGYLTLKR
jgi:gliding motility-associated-like protein